MAKTRRSNSSALQTVGGITAGLAVGAVGVPKVVAMIDPEGKLDPKIINGVGAAGAFWLSRKQKGLMQSALHGLAAGMAWNLISNVAGMGYVNDPSTSFLNRVAGPEDNYFPSRQNPGAI